ncbi:LytR/AlgR family response regulator transcription factor [Sphingobacterium faecium]|uniref:LytR/AlgR family response regulator transcription factor n=1 Tax=Sphingobacterium faecium TaxID=34087 RepID=UPI002469AC37|nr:LytTR family DNA-binding domain-containing protein [Sphingobacterium faecium]MDH5827542.1 LytTR family DNA-binding domain-containing protein [Sphingobacterium faecium]
MQVLIVEDETAAYESLVEILKEIDPSIQVLGNTESVSQTINWLNTHPAPDLILMDIHLSDGSAFLIFDHIQVEVPIIFITAYDEYAIDAFKVSSIDYLLKPIKSSDLERALQKFKRFSQNDLVSYITKITQLAPTSQYKDKLLISVQDKLLPIDLQTVAFFYTTDKNTSIYIKDGNNYRYSRTLDYIYTTLNPTKFYRANKQFIIARSSVQSITIWFDNRLLITLDIDTPERIYISKNKASDFKEWIVSG